MSSTVKLNLADLNSFWLTFSEIASRQVSFIDEDLIALSEKIDKEVGGTLALARTRIVDCEARIAACTAGIPAAMAADAAAAAAGETGNAVESLMQEIDLEKMKIQRLEALIPVVEAIGEENCSLRECYREDIDSLVKGYESRAPEVGVILGKFISSLNDAQEPFYTKAPITGAALGTTETSSSIVIPAKSEVPSLSSSSLESDILRIMDVSDSDSVSAELLFMGKGYADNVKDNSDAKTLDSLRSSESEGTIGHRGPKKHGSWIDAQGNLLGPSAVIDSGTYYWTPDSSHIFGGNRSNPMRKTAGEICAKYGFKSVLYIDGYPEFPPSTVVASVRLASPLAQDRPKNFKDAAQLLIASGGADVSDEFRQKVKEFMKGYPKGGDWFTSVSQVERFRRLHKLTWHETQDMRVIQLIPAEVHSMIIHDGGVSNAKYRDRIEREFRYLAMAAMDAALR